MKTFLPLLFVLLWHPDVSVEHSVKEVGYVRNTIAVQRRVIELGETDPNNIVNFTSVDLDQRFSPEKRPIPIYEIEVGTQSGTEEEGASYNVTENCQSEEVYDFELGACRLVCGDDHTYYWKLNVCVPVVNYNRVIRRPLCKNITIPRHEIHDKSSIDILKSYHKLTFGRGNYKNDTDGITFCYPFALDFMLCRRWALLPREYQLVDNGLSIWVSTDERKYTAGEFFLTKTKEAAVCVRNSSKVLPLTNPGRTTAYFVGCCISCVSLFLTCCVFVVENEWKYHTKVLFCHILSLFAFYLALIFRSKFLSLGTDLCVINGITMNFTFLATFFWLNVFAYEVWKKLGSLHVNPLNPPSHYFKFFLASIYAWGLPLAITGASVAANYLLPYTKQFNPQFRSQCWLSRETKAHLVFMYIPAAAILAANVVFFVKTVTKLRTIARDATMVNTKVHHQLLKTYLKLMIVMGVCWIMEVISAVVGDDSVWWAFTDIINCLQGFFIFIIYFFKHSTLQVIRRALNILS